MRRKIVQILFLDIIILQATFLFCHAKRHRKSREYLDLLSINKVNRKKQGKCHSLAQKEIIAMENIVK